MNLQPFRAKWEAFGWEVIEVDGHNHYQLTDALKRKKTLNKPLCIICSTIKGKGFSFMENNNLWHYRTAQGDEYENAKKELMK